MRETPQDTPEVTPAALREWNHHVESVMRGLAHALNNRAAALSAVIELSNEPDDDPAATREILQGEMDRVTELVRVVRILAVPRGEPEAIVPADLVADLKSILHLHADLRDRVADFAASEAVPVRVHRWMLVRALVALAATTTARQGERTFMVTLATEGDWLTARANAPRSSYMRELARAMGGEPNPDGSGFRIPTLESLRRREAR
jgi:hypothetical protein